MREAIRPRCLPRDAAVGAPRCGDVIPLGILRASAGRADEGRMLPAKAWVEAQAGGFGERCGRSSPGSAGFARRPVRGRQGSGRGLP